ncbi:MAG: YezD family protein [Chloroflexi bacterium]|nr:YezD family protein [Chloroflexota bacterium]
MPDLQVVNSRLRTDRTGSDGLRATGRVDSPARNPLLSTQRVDFIDFVQRLTGGPFWRWRWLLASLDPTRSEDLDTLVSELQRLLAGMRHGSVTVIVQDGRVVQLDATHKVRLAGAPAQRRQGGSAP